MVARQLVADRDWQAVAALPRVKGEGATLAFARGLAYAKLGDTTLAKRSLADIPNAPADSPSRIATTAAMRLTLSAEIVLLAHEDTKALGLLTDASTAALKGETLGGAEMPSLYYYSPHMALANLALRLGKVEVAKAALQAELAASPRSPAALQALAQLGASR
jgi:hypothetical protein